MNVITPCIGICRINKHTSLCEGCRRSMTEVAEWLYYDDDKKRRIIDEAARRDPFPAKT